MQIGVETARAVENKRVFVIDTDEIARAVVQFILHDEYETHELASLADAEAKARTGKPDLAIVGVDMLRAAGAQVIAQVAAGHPEAKILLVADPNSDGDLIASARSAGAHGILAKPLTVESVRDKVDVMLGRRVPVMVPLQVLTQGSGARG